MLKHKVGFICWVALAGSLSAAQASGGSATRYLVTREHMKLSIGRAVKGTQLFCTMR